MATLSMLVGLFALFQLSAAFVLPTDHYEDQFREWQVKYGREYNSEQERQARLKVFTENLLYIEQHNWAGHSYQLGVNQFADLTFEEFKTQHLMDSQNCPATVPPKKSYLIETAPPMAIDWRKMGAVAPVGAQLQCGSCWAFSAAGAVASHTFIKTKHLVPLSPQQLVDCAGFNNHGCDGGLPSQALEYIMYNKGIESEAVYPYTAHQGKCMFTPSKVVATVSGVVNITAGNEMEIYDAVGTKGPVSMSFDVTSDFRFYKSGVYSSASCMKTATDVNHSALIVGYNVTESGQDYWIVQNSWGKTFGMDGYFMIARGQNMCGLAECGSYPIV